jgi:UDPglucose 6-dehydrogenase
MNIGIIGLGVVGNACKQGFELQGHSVYAHDIKLNTTIDAVLDTEIVYVCVSTPSNSDGSNDVSNVEETIRLLDDRNYQGVVAIKSTVVPGTTKFFNDTTNLDVCFVPEFLRERCAVEDFVDNHTLLVVGTSDDRVYQTVKASHGSLPKTVRQLTETEAEIIKYYNNIFNAVRVVFANTMYEICEKTNSDYEKIKDVYLARGVASPDYMDCSDELRGYGGMCLPKDVNAFIHYLDDMGIKSEFLQAVRNDNKKFKTTVFKGMRL